MIIEHGDWAPYTPEKPEKIFGATVIYIKRASDSADWYTFVKSPPFKAGSVIMTVQRLSDGTCIVQAVSAEKDGVFPAKCLLIEETEPVRGVDLLEHYGHRYYDPATKTIGEKRKPPPDPLAQLMARLEQLEKQLERK